MIVHLNLGSSIEPRREHLRQAFAALDSAPGLRLLGGSRIYETPPVGVPGAEPFLNMCVAAKTSRRLECVLDMSRTSSAAWGAPRVQGEGAAAEHRHRPRLRGELRRDTARLTIPHPGLVTRSFFIWPLLEICPNASMPGSRLPLTVFLAGCVDPPILATQPGFGA